MPCILSKSRATRAGVVAAAIVVATASAPWEGPQCPRGLDPYSSEPNAFGWPITPSEFNFELPKCWAEKYPLCAGHHQSPLNVDLRIEDAACTVKTAPGDAPGSLATRAHYKVLTGSPIVTVSKYMRAVNVKGDLGALHLKDESGHSIEYQATDAFLTADSLHAFNGTLSDAELLIVHRPTSEPDAMSGSVIVSLRFKQGDAPSDLFSQMGFPATGDAATEGSMWPAPASIDLGAAVQSAMQGSFYAYSGSIPVPPCTENVHYIILETEMPVAQGQVRALKETLRDKAGGYRKRRAVDRMATGEFCRRVMPNSLIVPYTQTGCTKDTGMSAACWETTCDKSPINVLSQNTTTLDAESRTSPEFVYRPAEHAKVAPTAFELEVAGDFGGVVLDGRFFEAKKLSLKAVAQHTVDGVRYPAELVVHHSLYGESFSSHADHRRLEVEEHAGDAHHGHDVHQVLLSIPLTLGRESPLLRSLGLGDVVRRNAIRDGNGFDVHGPIDVGAALAGSTQGWYFYSGGPTSAGACPAWGVKWIVMQEPLQVSLEQLNSLALNVSGMDSTRMSQHMAPGAVFWAGVPKGAMEDEALKGASEQCRMTGSPSPVHIKTDAIGFVGQDNFLAKASWKPVSGLRLENVHNSLAFRTKQMGYFTITGADGFPQYHQVISVNLKMPSEHMVDGRQYPAELQVVHKKQKTVLEFEEDDGVVASFLFDFGEESKLLAQMLPKELPAPGAYVAISKPVDLMWAMGPAMDGKFVKYDGSFTTGTCREGARWVVFNKTMTLSMEQFQAYKAGFPGLTANLPIQPLKSRLLSQNAIEEGDMAEYRFFLNRQGGRNKDETPIGYIAFPIAGTFLLCLVMMTALFQREDKFRKGESAGGLTHHTGVGASTIGKGYSKI